VSKLRIKVVILILYICIILTGCQQEANERKVEDCINRNGNPKITYCNDNQNTICEVECFIEKVGE